MERGYRKRMVTTQILKARAESNDSVLERGNTRTFKSKLTLTSLTIQRFRMSEAYWRDFKFCQHQIKRMKNFFLRFQFLDSKIRKTLRNTQLASLPKIDNAGGFEPCAKGTCQMYEYIITTNTFTTKACGEVFIIQSGSLNCN